LLRVYGLALADWPGWYYLRFLFQLQVNVIRIKDKKTAGCVWSGNLTMPRVLNISGVVNKQRLIGYFFS